MDPNPDISRAEVTVHQALADISCALSRQGIEDPSLEAEIILTHILSCNRTTLYVNALRRLGNDERGSLRRALDLRLRYMPVQYITGSAPFCDFTLHVNTDVLIPRPETEVLVEEVLKRLNDLVIQNRYQVICDIGTGSGNMAIALADAYPEARVYATDLSSAALAVARRNAADHHLGNIIFLQGDLCEPLRSLSLPGKIDAIICNPPYIATAGIESLAREIRDFEPRLALDGGEDGLSLVRRLIRQASCFLKGGGLLALEVGQGQSQQVAGMMRENQFSGVEIIRDLSGIERVVIGTRT